MSVRQIMPGALRYSLMPNMLDQSSPLHKPFLLSALFFSGFAALIYEIVWQRILVRMLGGTFSSVSLIVCVFLGGMAIGAMLVSIAQSKNKIKSPGKVWAVLEGLLGVCGIASIALARLSAFPLPDQTVTSAIAIFLLLIPTICMGAVLPIAIDLFNQKNDQKNNSTTLVIYALNTTGALVGALLSAFAFLPWFGISTTLCIAAMVNLAICLSLKLLKTELQIEAKESPEKFQFDSSLIYHLSFASGLVIVLLELAWTRFFGFLGGFNTYMFSLVLIFILAGLSIGAWLVRDIKTRFRENDHNSFLAITAMTALGALCVGISCYAAYNLPGQYNSLMNQLQKSCPALSYFQIKLIVLASAMNMIILFPSTVCGTLFPLLLGHENTLSTSSNRSRNAAIKLALNAAGSVSGYLVLRSLYDVHTTYGVVDSSILAVIALLSVLAVTLLIKQKLSLLMVIFILIMLPVSLFRPLPTRFFPSPIADDCEENPEAIVCVAREHGLLRLTINGKAQGAIPDLIPCDFAPTGSDKPTQVLLGILPPLLNKTKHSSGLVIGMGTGTTCGAAIALESVKQCTVIDINPAVFRAAYKFASSNQSPWDSPKYNKVVGDARTYLSTGKTKFDWITSQPGEPSNAGSADLFTQEFYQLAKRRLTPDGIFAQWIQLYGLTSSDLIVLLDTFKSVFPDTYIFQARGAGEVILVSIPQGASKQSLEEKCRGMYTSAGCLRQLYSIGIESHYDLFADCISKPTKVSNQNLINTDDNLLVEMSAAKVEPPSERQIERLEDTLLTTCILDESSGDPCIKQAQTARFIPLFTGVSDYFLLSVLEPETVSPLEKTNRIDTYAALAVKEGDYKKAKDWFETDPYKSESPAGLTGMALCSYKSGEDPNEAYIKFVKSLDINPLQYIASFYAGKCAYSMGRTQDALYHMKFASQVFYKSNQPRFFICAALLKDGQIDLAKRNLKSLNNRTLKTDKEKGWLEGLNKTISSGQEDSCIDEILAL